MDCRVRHTGATLLQWGLGLAGLVLLWFGARAVIDRANATPEMQVSTTPLWTRVTAPEAELPRSFDVSPTRVKKHLSVLLDGEALPFSTRDTHQGDDCFAVDIEWPRPLLPGFHVLEFRPGYGKAEKRASVIPFVVGPTVKVEGWTRHAVRLTVSQELLDGKRDSLAAVVERVVAERLGDGQHPVEAKVDIAWSETGFTLSGQGSRSDGTRVDFGGDFRVAVEAPGVMHVRRDGAMRFSLAGPMLTKVKGLGAGGGALVGTLVAGPIGTVGGLVAGWLTSAKAPARLARHQLETQIDTMLQKFDTSLDFEPVKLDARGTMLELRPSGPPIIIPGRTFQIDLDMRLSGTQAVQQAPLVLGHGLPQGPFPRKARIVAAVDLDAMNRLLYVMWSAGDLKSVFTRPAVLRQVNEGLMQTTLLPESASVASPPLLSHVGDGPLKLYLPRIEATFVDIENQHSYRLVLTGGAALSASLDAPAQTLRIDVDEPELWGSCWTEEPDSTSVSPCLSELVSFGKRKLHAGGSAHRQPVLKIALGELLPVLGGNDAQAMIQPNLRSLEACLSDEGAAGAGLVLAADLGFSAPRPAVERVQ